MARSIRRGVPCVGTSGVEPERDQRQLNRSGRARHPPPSRGADDQLAGDVFPPAARAAPRSAAASDTPRGSTRPAARIADPPPHSRRRWWIPVVSRSGEGKPIARSMGGQGVTTAGKDDACAWWPGRISAGRVHLPREIARSEIGELCAAEALTIDRGKLRWKANRRATESPVGRGRPRRPRSPLPPAHGAATPARLVAV